MLFFSAVARWRQQSRSIDDGLAGLRGETAARDELGAVIDLAFDEARHVTVALARVASADVPLQVHASLSARGGARRARLRQPAAQAQLLSRRRRSTCPSLNVDAFFVTLQKSEADYSPTTMYRDYPISPTLFHWESQSATSVASTTGQRYLNGTSTKLLFVRQRRLRVRDEPVPLRRPGSLRQHTGERPIAITWRLEHALPTDVFAAATVAAS